MLVVGSGPGGAIVAKELAERGRNVIVVEAGPIVREQHVRKDAGNTLARFFWYSGLRTSRGNLFMPTLQAKNLGGGSVWNSAICLRHPEFVRKRWERDHGFSHPDIDRNYAAVESFMGVKPVDPSIQGVRNERFRDACNEMGYQPTVIERNENGCKGSGECLTSCPNDAKLSTDKRGIPEFLAAGGRVYTSLQVDKLIMSGTRVRGIVGTVREPFTGKKSHRVRITAKTTVLAAGALASPAIMQASGIDHEPVGANLGFHPGTMVMGVFDDVVEPWHGAAQGYHCLDFLEDGIKLESLWATTSLMAFRFPGFGQEFKDKLAMYRNMASWDAWVSGEDSKGWVRHRRGRRPDVYYEVGQGDVERVVESMAKLTEMFFAVGAKEVLLGVHGLPAVCRDVSIAGEMRRTHFDPKRLPLASNHVFGSTAMGVDPERHVVDPNGAAYGVDGLYVADTGIIPDSPGVNPMLPVMALAHHIAEQIDQAR